MYDNRDGSLAILGEDVMDRERRRLQDIKPALPPEEVSRRAMVAAGEANGIPEKYQGPVFSIGDELDINGGRFKVARFKHGKMLLSGLPSEKEED